MDLSALLLDQNVIKHRKILLYKGLHLTKLKEIYARYMLQLLKLMLHMLS